MNVVCRISRGPFPNNKPCWYLFIISNISLCVWWVLCCYYIIDDTNLLATAAAAAIPLTPTAIMSCHLYLFGLNRSLDVLGCETNKH